MSQRRRRPSAGDLVPTLAVTGRADLTDAQWAVLEPLLPRGKKPGRPPDGRRRQLIDGIRWRTRTGAPWRDVPERYGPWQTVYGLFRRWQRNGTWREILTALQGAGRCGRADHLGRVGGLHGRAGAPARGRGAQKGDLQAEPPGGVDDEPADHGLGRSRGGLTTKVHLACEQGQKPLSVVITAGQRGDSPQFAGRARAHPGTPAGPAAPRTRPDRVLADKAYGSRAQPRLPAAARRSGARSRRRPTRSATARPRAARAAARPPSTRNCTRPATPSSAASTGSSATAPWPPATTSSPSATKPPSTSPRSTNGSYPTFETRPRLKF